MADDIEQLISQTLGIDPGRMRPDLEFGAVPEWDSLGHVDLMLALEQRLDTEIDAEAIVELTSVQAIRDYVEAREAGG